MLPLLFSSSFAACTRSSTAGDEDEEMKNITLRAKKASRMYRKYRDEPAISESLCLAAVFSMVVCSGKGG